MRVCRIKDWSWNQFSFKTYHEFSDYVDQNFSKELNNDQVHTDLIVVLPYGPKGGVKKGEKLIADNGRYFIPSELIWKAKQVQESVNQEISAGIGLYRTGFEQGLPSYYIGEYLDNAGLIKK